MKKDHPAYCESLCYTEQQVEAFIRQALRERANRPFVGIDVKKLGGYRLVTISDHLGEPTSP